MDPIVVVIIVVVGTPVGVVLGLAYAARLRGPAHRKESRRPVRSLVTDVVPEDADSDEDPTWAIDSAPLERGPGLHDR